MKPQNILLLYTTALLVFAGTNVRAEEPKVGAEHSANMAKGLEVFKASVRKVLLDSCVNCHGGEKTKGELDIATREALLKGGKSGKVVVIGDAKASLFYKLITHEEEPPMPQKKPKLPQADIDAIAQWINLGAPYDKPLVEQTANAGAKKPMVVTEKDKQFWSFKPLKKTAPPAVKNEAWCKTPVDRFILAAMEAKQLSPNPPTDKRRLIRRAYFDLIGLPPTPEEVAAFENDNSPDAYPKLIDKLLESPHYGERWGRHWLDVSRFAESHGFEQDYDRPYAYFFRDFVIKALNQDLPYDKFVKWQLAGDEFEPDNPMALMATGFIGAGVFPTQITANEVERTRYDALDDMAATMGTAMLGLTVGCARCHDHKYDPIPTNDYYRLISTFTTTVRSNYDVVLDNENYKQAKAKFDSEHKPLLDALQNYEKNELAKKLDEYLKNLPKEATADAPVWNTLDLVEYKSEGGATLTKQPDLSVLASGKSPDNDTYVFTAHTSLSNIRAIKIEALADASMKKNGPGRAENGNFALTNTKVRIWDREKPPDPKNPKVGSIDIPLKSIAATFEQKGLPASAAIAGGKSSGWAIDPEFGKNHAAVFQTPQPIGGPNHAFQITLKFENNKAHSIGRPRLSISTQENPKIDAPSSPQNLAEIRAIFASTGDVERLTPVQREELLKWYKPLDAEWQKLSAAVAEHAKKEPHPKTEKVMICSEGVAAIRHHTQGGDFLPETHVLNRGDCNQKKGVATQGFLTVLMNHPDQEKHWIETPPAGWRTSYRRRSLANWITDTQFGAGHLLARVMVNRLWQHHFGKGIVSTPNDFGFQGEAPTHPELLDWLATNLIEGGWKLKPLHKLIMTSSVYMQNTQFDEAKFKIDQSNQFCWRRNPQRLEGEVIRDSMLSVSGVLETTMFGPGTLDEGMKRRSIYFMIKRSKLIPMMQLFDAPEPTVSIGGRVSTTIAPQALMFINSPHVRNYANSFANRLKPFASKSLEEAVTEGYQLTLNRKPTAAELTESVAFINKQIESYQTENRGNGRDLALADFCQVLFSLNEFVYDE